MLTRKLLFDTKLHQISEFQQKLETIWSKEERYLITSRKQLEFKLGVYVIPDTEQIKIIIIIQGPKSIGDDSSVMGCTAK